MPRRRGSGLTAIPEAFSLRAVGYLPQLFGRFHQDAAGNITGSQVRTVAGNAAAEDISGTFTVNRDCTVTGTINVLVNGELQRTAVIVGVYDTNLNHGRDIFQSLTLANGTNVPVVLSAEAARLFPED